MEHLCECSQHGYSQPGRHGIDGCCSVWTDMGEVLVARGDRDCSSAVCEAWELALAGSAYDGLITRYNWTGGMREMFTNSGLFTWEYPDFEASRGDIYLDESSHTAMCVRGDGSGDLVAEFSISETGGIDGEPGDQTGCESLVRDDYRSWDGVLHYNGMADGTETLGYGSGEPAGDTATLAVRVLAGAFGNGEERRRRLGARYDEVQAEVNRILGAGWEETGEAEAAGGEEPGEGCEEGGAAGGEASWLSEADVDALAHRAIAGEFGNGEERRRNLGSCYDVVQERVNEVLSYACPFSGAVNVDAMARAVVDGCYGDGEERRRRLGAYYETVQARVNQLLA